MITWVIIALNIFGGGIKTYRAVFLQVKESPYIEAAQAWLHGKLLVSFLIEALIVAGERFFPWGYPISEEISQVPLYLERDVIDVPSI